MTARRLHVLINQLIGDPSSALLRSVAPDAAEWVAGDYILADLLDLTARANFQNPQRYPRPGDARRAAEREAQHTAALKAQNERAKRQLAEMEGADLA